MSRYCLKTHRDHIHFFIDIYNSFAIKLSARVQDVQTTALLQLFLQRPKKTALNDDWDDYPITTALVMAMCQNAAGSGDRLDRLFWGYLTSGSSSTAGESISDSSGYPALIGGKTSSDGNFGVCCESQLQIGLAVRIDADAQQAGQVDALGSTGASSQDACQSAVLVARAAVLQDAHRMGGGSSWHICWARAAVAVRGADAAASTFHFSLNLVALARRFLVVALAGRAWWRWRRRRRRWPTARNHRVGGLGLDTTLTCTWLATLKLHKALLAPSGSPAVLHLTSQIPSVSDQSKGQQHASTPQKA